MVATQKPPGGVAQKHFGGLRPGSWSSLTRQVHSRICACLPGIGLRRSREGEPASTVSVSTTSTGSVSFGPFRGCAGSKL